MAERNELLAEDELVTKTNRRQAKLVATMAAACVCVVLGLIAGLLAFVAVGLVGLAVGVLVWVVATVLLAMAIWYRASALVLRSLGARPSSPAEQPRLHNLVDGLCATMGLPVPDIYVVEHGAPNACAVGRNPLSAALVVTSGLDQCLSVVELEGVLAHELVHIRRQDTVAGSVIAVSVLPLGWLSLSSERVIRRLLGAGREFAADQRAVRVVRYPPGLGSALEVMALASTEPGATGNDRRAEAGRAPWSASGNRLGASTRWLWIDPVGSGGAPPTDGDLDHTSVRAAALALR